METDPPPPTDSSPGPPQRRWLRRLVIAAAILVSFILALAFVLLLAGRRYLEHALETGVQAGAYSIEARAPSIDLLGLAVSAQDLRVHGPAVRAAASDLRLRVRLLTGVRWDPSIALQAREVDVDLQRPPPPHPDSARPFRDTLSFPDFALPAGVAVTVELVRIADRGTALATIRGLALRSRGARRIDLAADTVVWSKLPRLRLATRAHADWRGDSLAVSVALRAGVDSLAAAARLERRNLGRGSGRIGLSIASPGSHLPDTSLRRRMAGLEDLSVTLSARAATRRDSAAGVLLEALAAEGTLRARTGPVPLKALRDIAPQNVVLGFELADWRGRWRLTSQGGGQKTQLAGTISSPGTGTTPRPPGNRSRAQPPARTLGEVAAALAGTAAGRIDGLPVHIGRRTIRTGYAIENARFSRADAFARLVTADGSRIDVAMRRPASRWSGDFRIVAAPGEEWIRVFVDSLRWASLEARGIIAGGGIEGEVRARGARLRAIQADSVIAFQRIRRGVYRLEKGMLHSDGIPWLVTGFARRGRSEFSAENPDAGRVFVGYGPNRRLEVAAEELSPELLPLAGLRGARDSMPIRDSRITGSLFWDRLSGRGTLDARGGGMFRDRAIQALTNARWDGRVFSVRRLEIHGSPGDLLATAEIRTHGKPFPKGGPGLVGDILSAEISTRRFDLADALGAGLPRSPLRSGQLEGAMGYRSGEGLSGTFHLHDLAPTALAGRLTIDEARLEGRGDSVAFAFRTSSPEPLLSDSGSLRVTGLLAEEPTIVGEVVAARSLRMEFLARLRDGSTAGALRASGRVPLPGKAGAIDSFRLDAEFEVPWDKPGNARIEARTLAGQFAIPGIDTQSFAIPFRLADGLVEAPAISVVNRKGERLGGSARYVLADRRASLHLEGQSLSLAWKETFQATLRDLVLDLRSDTASTAARLRFSEGDISHAAGRLGFAGRLAEVDASFISPRSRQVRRRGAQAPIPEIRARAVLEESELRYRLRTFDALQDLFRRRKQEARVRRDRQVRVQLDIATRGTDNRIETDVLRMNYIANLRLRGTYPFALAQGRVSSIQGEIGARDEGYDIRDFELKWLNSPLEEGEVALRAEKMLASDCLADTAASIDSCLVATELRGELANLHFSYETDCGGAFGAGADIAALLYSVRRGCYSPEFSTGGAGGAGYEERALTLLEPAVSQGLSQMARALSGRWIARAQVTGLGGLAADSVTQAVSLEILTREWRRLRMRVRGGYRPEALADVSPWEHRLALEWRPPLGRIFGRPERVGLLRNDVRVEASIETDPDAQRTRSDDPIRRRLGLTYTFEFWRFR